MLLFYFVVQGDIWWERVGDTDLFHISIIFDHFHGIPIDFPGCSFLPPHESCSMPFLWFSHEAVWAARFPDARETLVHADHGIDFWGTLQLGRINWVLPDLSHHPVAWHWSWRDQHPVSCPNLHESSFTEVLKLLRWRAMATNHVRLYRCLWLHSCFGHASDDPVQQEIKEDTRSVFTSYPQWEPQQNFIAKVWNLQLENHPVTWAAKRGTTMRLDYEGSWPN